MPGKRAAGQKLINVPVDEKFLEEIDAAIKQTDYDNRAEFIRDAIVEKLKGEGYPVTASLSRSPSRFGKGGRPPQRTPAHGSNDTASSRKASASAKLLKKGAASALKPDAK